VLDRLLVLLVLVQQPREVQVDRDDPVCEIVARKVIEIGQNGLLDPEVIAGETVRRLGLA